MRPSLIGIVASGTNTPNPVWSTGGTASASSFYSVGGDVRPASNAFDGDPATRWSTVASAGLEKYLQYDRGTGRAAAIGSVRINIELASQMPADFTIDASNDGASWTTTHTVTEHTWADDDDTSFDFSDTGTYRYCRIHTPDWSEAFMTIREFEVLKP
jgi:hypothetical protein